MNVQGVVHPGQWCNKWTSKPMTCLHLLYIAHWLSLRYVCEQYMKDALTLAVCQRYNIIDHTHVWHPPPLIGTPHYVMIPSDWSSMRPWWLDIATPTIVFWRVILSKMHISLISSSRVQMSDLAINPLVPPRHALATKPWGYSCNFNSDCKSLFYLINWSTIFYYPNKVGEILGALHGVVVRFF